MIRLWASLFWLYRVIEIPGKLKLGSITKPFRLDPNLILEWLDFLTKYSKIILEMFGELKNRNSLGRSPYEAESQVRETWFNQYAPDKESEFIVDITAWMGTIIGVPPLIKAFSSKSGVPYLEYPKPRKTLLLTSGPNSAKGPDEGPGPLTRTSIGSILTDILMWKTLEGRKLWDEGCRLGPFARMFLLDMFNSADSAFKQLRNEEMLKDTQLMWDGPYSVTDETGVPIKGFSVARSFGKLAFLPEPAGKIRIIAMFDSITQMLLRPLHDVVFGFLRRIPQDGTFDQEAPARLLTKSGCRTFWSYDLSAATDRFPVSLQQSLLSLLYGPWVGRAWRSLLNDREFTVPRWIGKTRVPPGTPKSVRYGAGQPMGAYTSWAVFSLSHHLVVQWAAYRATNRVQWFTLYALLGDDVVIGDKAVAKSYLNLLRAIGVEIGLAKSLISSNGTFEFAKRTFKNGVNLSGWSLDAVGASVNDPTVMEDLVSRTSARGMREALKIGLRVQGYGGEAISRVLNSSLDLSLRRPTILALWFSRPGSVFGMETFTDWVTQPRVAERGYISNDELDLTLRDSLRQRLVSSAEKLVEARLALLDKMGGPAYSTVDLIEMDGSHVKMVKTPPGLRVGIPRYEAFLTEWVIRPYVEQITSELTELQADVKSWAEADISIFSLDEIYKSLEAVLADLAVGAKEISLFRRASDLEKVHRIGQRSRTIKNWIRARALIRKGL
jgi:hypothetical protein